MFARCLFGLIIVITLDAASASRLVHGQEVGDTKPVAKPDAADEVPREQRIADYLTGATFVGSFTVDKTGVNKLSEEKYKIIKCEKLPEGDRYRLTTRITYGETDGEFPMELDILWAGNTPVITLDNVWIPALGTFSARVLILDGRYAGTWEHNPVGGHLFGKIVKEP